MGIYYKLDNKIPVPCSARKAQEQFLNADGRLVSETKVGPLRISTVFLVLDHNFSGNGMPVLFETMIFDDYENDYASNYQECYRTWDEAEAGHRRAVEYAKQLVGKADDLLRSETR